MVEKVWNCPEIFRVYVPLPDNPLKNLNSYVIRTPSASLVIDTGFRRPECRAALWAGLEELGLDLSKTILFLTHLHADHTGLVWDFVDRGVPVYMGDSYDGHFYQTENRHFRAIQPLYLSEGYPEAQMALQTQNQAITFSPQSGFPVHLIRDGETLPLEGLTVKAICTPGHTPGHMVLYLPEEKLLFSGDHILFDITPNISIWLQVPHSLADYINSLKKIKELDIVETFPAHRGAGKKDVYQRIDELIAHHDRRLDEIYQAAKARPGSTAYQLASQIHWSMRGLPWDSFPPTQQWFATGETLSHLYYLTDNGRLRRVEENGLYRYFPT